MKGSAITGKRFCRKGNQPQKENLSENHTKKMQAQWPRSAQTFGQESLPTRAPFAELQTTELSISSSPADHWLFNDLLASSSKFNPTNHVLVKIQSDQ